MFIEVWRVTAYLYIFQLFSVNMYVTRSSTCFSMKLGCMMKILLYSEKYFKMNWLQVLYAEYDSNEVDHTDKHQFEPSRYDIYVLYRNLHFCTM
jgi:hypothetical protein